MTFFSVAPVGLLVVAALVGCSSSGNVVVYQGQYDGQTYVVESYKTTSFTDSRVDWRLRLGNLPEVPINIRRRGTPVGPTGAVTTDWAPPYDDALFDGRAHAYLDGAPAYSSAGDDYRGVEAQHDTTMLYVSERLTREQFLRYEAFMRAEWANVDRALASSDNNFPHIVGLVHGSRRLFVRSFRGTVDGVAYVLRVDPDGYVNFGPDDGSAEGNSMRHCKVQMPERRIVLHDIYTWSNYGLNREDVLGFRDAEGRSPGFYFDLEE